MNTKKSNIELFEDPKRQKSFLSRVKRFGGILKLDFRPEFEKDPKAFKHSLVATLKTAFRGKAGRRRNPAVRKAAELYDQAYASLDREGNWHEIAKKVFPDYLGLPLEIQQNRRYQLRAAVHSLRHEEKGRAKRQERRKHLASAPEIPSWSTSTVPSLGAPSKRAKTETPSGKSQSGST